MASIEKIVEGDGVITVYFNSPYSVQVADISTQEPQQPPRQQQQQLRWVSGEPTTLKVMMKTILHKLFEADLANCDCHQ